MPPQSPPAAPVPLDVDPRQFYRNPRRARGGWSRTPDGNGRVRLFISLTPDDACALDEEAGAFSPTSFAAGEIVAAVREAKARRAAGKS
jgi:hypothetical protein